ncbi:uncharacterized protein PHALS_07777 [Plasmopara halstedii]|uniref:Uncharacterized protein n=1 Tax=Plasmopara halstedii TaxID=4781 RepID=A0A0P1B6F7_PLAHL|nr:uncharacterized protein PHALS_07777 [Plasmopara halstedii]CEG50048.1 hypothetical protein PHALS_07777 [Plasmopara halstedii]|eukprot:XP_024586417.1 hypothetical protein PHALS_07777 [Plasmopara halstedii]
MPPGYTQSLPLWTSLYSVNKALNDDELLYLSGDETDCDSERGSDTLSREDQQLLLHHQQDRDEKNVDHSVVLRSCKRPTTPLSIPAQTHQYIAKCSDRWIWDEDDDDERNACTCCCDRSAPSTYPHTTTSNDLMFDLEL